MKILILNGPNLNMLGAREKEVYGELTLDGLNAEISAFCAKSGIKTDFFQSNIEGELVTAIQTAESVYGADAIIINAGAYTHYSIALKDALNSVKNLPKAEVHISNVHAREEYRHVSMLADACCGVICGFGADSYCMAALALRNIVEKKQRKN